MGKVVSLLHETKLESYCNEQNTILNFSELIVLVRIMLWTPVSWYFSQMAITTGPLFQNVLLPWFLWRSRSRGSRRYLSAQLVRNLSYPRNRFSRRNKIDYFIETRPFDVIWFGCHTDRYTSQWSLLKPKSRRIGSIRNGVWVFYSAGLRIQFISFPLFVVRRIDSTVKSGSISAIAGVESVLWEVK